VEMMNNKNITIEVRNILRKLFKNLSLILAGIFLFVWVFHILIPNYGWLSAENLWEVKVVLAGMVLGLFVNERYS
jgi:hypothetical protein